MVEVIEGLDLSAMSKSDRGSGSASYPPVLLVSLLVYGYATGVFSSRTLARNDKQQLAPMLDKLAGLPDDSGQAETLLADIGYCRQANVEACAKAGITPLIAQGRQPHHPPLDERFAPPPPAPQDPTPLDTMAHRLKTPDGRKRYALRKPRWSRSSASSSRFWASGSSRCAVSPARGEWSLVTAAWTMKRMFILSRAVA